MIDSIKKISVTWNLPKRGSLFDASDINNLIIFDMPECECEKLDSVEEGECSNCKSYIQIICRLNDGSEYTISFDTVCYVLNDNGKTIEKIVANYKE
jgi:hypothetical protein